MFFNKKKSSLKISNPINFNDVTSPGSFDETIPLNNNNNNNKDNHEKKAMVQKPVSPVFKIPTSPTETTRHHQSSGPAIVLMAKFNFQAHNSKELTVSINEPLKLLSRQGNGWLLVKPIGRLGGPGLVPSAYCSLVDNSSSLNEQWLDGSDIVVPTSDQDGFQQKQKNERASSGISDSASSTSTNSMDRTSPTSVSSVEDLPILSKPIAMSISVKTVSSHKGRYWYRTDVLLPKSKTRFLCRYYQDFYALHVSLHSHLSNNGMKNLLPKLPGPIPRPEPEVLLQRCHDLNAYIQSLLQLFANDFKDREVALEVFQNWLNIRDGDVEIEEKEYFSLKTEDINKLIEPISPNAATFKDQISQQRQQQNYSAFTPPLNMNSTESSPISSPLTTSTTTSNQVFKNDPETPKRKQLTVNTSLEYSPTSPLFHHDKPKLNFITERRIHSPIQSSRPTFQIEEYIKVKVIYNDGNDIIVMKMLKDSNLTILKLSISSKTHIYDYVLSYKDVKSGFFKPLRTNKDLEDAINKNKIVIKVNEANVV